MDWDVLLRDNRDRVLQRVHDACARAGRDPGGVRILAVTKTQPLEAIAAARRVGFDRFGENRVQEARAKAACGAFAGARLDIIGSLQSNKVKAAVAIADGVQSVDRVDIARELDRRAREWGKILEVLLELNTSGEAQKHGVRTLADLEALAETVLGLAALRLTGLMTLAPFSGDEALVRPCFARLYQARERLRDRLGVALPELSMGMSGDYPWAILEGSTLLRLGTALFGERP